VVCNAPCALAARSGVVGLGGLSPVAVSFGYDVAAGNITALRLYFTGPAQP